MNKKFVKSALTHLCCDLVGLILSDGGSAGCILRPKKINKSLKQVINASVSKGFVTKAGNLYSATEKGIELVNSRRVSDTAALAARCFSQSQSQS